MSSSLTSKANFNLITSIRREINKLLHFDLSTDSSSSQLDSDAELLKHSFKCLILDDQSCSVLSPILTLSTMKQNNICLNLNIKDKRSPLPDVLAVYIVQSTKGNLNEIIKDMKERLYENYCINFIDVPRNDDFKAFQSDIISIDSIRKIYRICAIPMNIATYHPNVFDLNVKCPYLKLNSPQFKQEEVAYVNCIADGIFASLYLLRLLPQAIFRIGWFAQEVIERVQRKFDDVFNKFPQLKEEFKPNSALIVIDRDSDLPIMLHHSASLGAMLSDIYGITRFPSTKEFLIDPINDYIWNDSLHKPFYQVGEQTLKDAKKYSGEMKQFDGLKSSKDIEALSRETEMLSLSLELHKNAKVKGDILTRQSKFFIEMNEICTKNNLGQLFDIEEIILRQRVSSNTEIDEKYEAIMQVMKEDNREDIIRMNVIRLLMAKKMEEVQAISESIKAMSGSKQSALLSALTYLTVKKKEELKGVQVIESSSYLSKVSKYVWNKFGSLMSIEQPSVVADIANTICLGREVKDFTTFNLQTGKKSNVIWSFNEAIVFVIGGGSLIEYEYIQDLLSRNQISLIYGCDKLYSPKEFIKDISELSSVLANRP